MKHESLVKVFKTRCEVLWAGSGHAANQIACAQFQALHSLGRFLRFETPVVLATHLNLLTSALLTHVETQNHAKGVSGATL